MAFSFEPSWLQDTPWRDLRTHQWGSLRDAEREDARWQCACPLKPRPRRACCHPGENSDSTPDRGKAPLTWMTGHVKGSGRWLWKHAPLQTDASFSKLTGVFSWRIFFLVHFRLGGNGCLMVLRQCRAGERESHSFHGWRPPGESPWGLWSRTLELCQVRLHTGHKKRQNEILLWVSEPPWSILERQDDLEN